MIATFRSVGIGLICGLALGLSTACGDRRSGPAAPSAVPALAGMASLDPAGTAPRSATTLTGDALARCFGAVDTAGCFSVPADSLGGETIGAAATGLPGAPTSLSHTVTGTTVTLAWGPVAAGGDPVTYVVEAGTASGLANLLQSPVGLGLSLTANSVPFGAYFVRVRAWNLSGLGPASNEIVVTVAPPPPPPCGASFVVCDNLQGSTVGVMLGGGAFDSFGWVATSGNASIGYQLPTITSGFFEAEVAGIRQQGNEGNIKAKILVMFDGSWSSGNLFRATAEKRDANKSNIIRFKFLSGNGAPGAYIEEDSPPNPGWDPNEIYKFRMEWGGGVAGVRVTRSNGTELFTIVGGYGGTYAPPRHIASVGLTGDGGHPTVVGMRVRNVRIGRK